MHYVGIFTYPLILYYANAIHKHPRTTHPRTMNFEDGGPTGIKVDIAVI